MRKAPNGKSGDGRPESWARWLLAERLDLSASSRLLIIQALVCAILAALFGFLLVLSVLQTASRFEIAFRWRPVTAIILEVEPAGVGSRGEYLFNLRLEVDRAASPRVRGMTLEPVAVRKSWSAPLRPPVVGERIAVYLDPDDARRMMPAEAVADRWGLLAILSLLFASTIASLVRSWTRMAIWLRRRRDQGKSVA